MRRSATATALLLVSASAAGAGESADPPPPPAYVHELDPGRSAYGVPEGFQQHDGFYLRFYFGPGFTLQRSSRIDIRGVGAATGIAAGGTIAHNLILFGELRSHLAINPSVEQSGVDLDTSNTVAGIGSIGGGLTFYTPTNAYLSGSLAFTSLRVRDDEGQTSNSETGIALALTLGKEWWVSAEWAIGIAARAEYSRNRDENVAGTWNTFAGSLGLSVTFN